MMTETLVWEPATPPKAINHAYSDKALGALEATFGKYPITLTPDDLRVLRAMDLVGGQRPIRDLVVLVEKYGSIRIWMSPGYPGQSEFDPREVLGREKPRCP